MEVNADLERAKAALETYTETEDERRQRQIEGQKLGEELRRMKEEQRRMKLVIISIVAHLPMKSHVLQKMYIMFTYVYIYV